MVCVTCPHEEANQLHPATPVRFFFLDIGCDDLNHGSVDDSGIGLLCAPFLATFTNLA